MCYAGMLVAVLALGPAAGTAPPGGKKKEWVAVVLTIGNGKVTEAKSVSDTHLHVDPKGRVRLGKWLVWVDPGEYAAACLKDQDFAHIIVELDFPDETPAPVVLRVIDQLKRGVKDGKRVELTIRYLATPEKG
ncbi:MAG: hypothetical protein C0501_16885 [Isosphaera sp.]|nr:hypothetical protein [Isosphaera sp.]